MNLRESTGIRLVRLTGSLLLWTSDSSLFGRYDITLRRFHYQNSIHTIRTVSCLRQVSQPFASDFSPHMIECHDSRLPSENEDRQVASLADQATALDEAAARFWIHAIEHLPQMGVSAEQQALAKHGLNYVIDTYLPEKLKHPERFLP